MIEQNICAKRSKTNYRVYSLAKTVFCILILILAVIFANEIRDGVIYGIRLSALCVIPAVFPFFVPSDLLCSLKLNRGFLARCFERLYSISSELFDCFIFSSVCGFAIGSRLCAEKGKSALLSKNDLSLGILLCSNPSLGFCIGALGVGCFSSIKAGIVLFFAMLLSTMITGLLFKEKDTKAKLYKYQKAEYIPGQSFDLSLSVKNAASSAICVSAFIIFFSAVISLIESLVANDLFLFISASFFEVGNACARLCALDLPSSIAFLLGGFSIGFSGISVILQAQSATPYPPSFRRFILFKFTEGGICAILSFLASLVIRF